MELHCRIASSAHPHLVQQILNSITSEQHNTLKYPKLELDHEANTCLYSYSPIDKVFICFLCPLPLTRSSLEKHIFVHNISSLIIPNSYSWAAQAGTAGMSVLRYAWSPSLAVDLQDASAVIIPARSMIFHHSASLEVGSTRYYIVPGEGRYQIKVTRCHSVDGSDKFHVSLSRNTSLPRIQNSTYLFSLSASSDPLYPPAPDVTPSRTSVINQISRPSYLSPVRYSDQRLSWSSHSSHHPNHEALTLSNSPSPAQLHPQRFISVSPNLSIRSPSTLDYQNNQKYFTISTTAANHSPSLTLQSVPYSVRGPAILRTNGNMIRRKQNRITKPKPVPITCLVTAIPPESNATIPTKTISVYPPKPRVAVTYLKTDTNNFIKKPLEVIVSVPSEITAAVAKPVILTFTQPPALILAKTPETSSTKLATMSPKPILNKSPKIISNKSPSLSLTNLPELIATKPSELILTKPTKLAVTIPTTPPELNPTEPPALTSTNSLESSVSKPDESNPTSSEILVTNPKDSTASVPNKCEDSETNEAGSSRDLRKRKTIVYDDKDTSPTKLAKIEEVLESSITFLKEPHKLLRRHNLELSSNDILSLGDEQFLNDQIIDFWLLELNSRLSELDRNRTHMFSTFFYKRLTTTNKKKSCSWESNAKMSIMQKRHCRVKNWTKNVDLFSKDFIIIPVIEDSHWYLAIICFPGLEGVCNLDSTKAPYENKDIIYVQKRKSGKVVATTKIGETAPTRRKLASEDTEANIEDNPDVVQPCILIFDSLKNDNQHPKIYQILRQYLQVEHLERKKKPREFDRLNTPGFQPSVPQQPNYCDCGIFLISYVEAFFNKPIKSYWLPISNLGNWFSPSIVHTKRKEVYDTIVEFIKTDAPENISYIPQIKFSELSESVIEDS